MEIDYDAIIDEELNALSDCSSIYSEDDEINEVSEFEEQAAFESADNHDWLDLFLEKTSQQASKTATLLYDAQEVLNEVNAVEGWSHSQYDKTEIEVNAQDVAIVTKVKEQFELAGPDAEHRNGKEIDETSDEEIKSEYCTDNEDKDNCSDKKDDSFQDLEERLSKIAETFEKHHSESQLKMNAMEKECEDEVNFQMDEIEAERLKMQKHLSQIAEAEMEILTELSKQKEFFLKEKQTKAACLIQARYKGFKVRRQYGEEVNTKIKASKQKRWEERVARVEEARKTKQVESTPLEQTPKANMEYEEPHVIELKTDAKPMNKGSIEEIQHITEFDSDTSANEITKNDNVVRIKAFPFEASVKETVTPKENNKTSLIEQINRDLECLAGTDDQQNLLHNSSSPNIQDNRSPRLNSQSGTSVSETADNGMLGLRGTQQSYSKADVSHCSVVNHPSKNIMSAIDKDLKELQKSVHFDDTTVHFSNSPSLQTDDGHVDNIKTINKATVLSSKSNFPDLVTTADKTASVENFSAPFQPTVENILQPDTKPLHDSKAPSATENKSEYPIKRDETPEPNMKVDSEQSTGHNKETISTLEASESSDHHCITEEHMPDESEVECVEITAVQIDPTLNQPTSTDDKKQCSDGIGQENRSMSESGDIEKDTMFSAGKYNQSVDGVVDNVSVRVEDNTHINTVSQVAESPTPTENTTKEENVSVNICNDVNHDLNLAASEENFLKENVKINKKVSDNLQLEETQQISDTKEHEISLNNTDSTVDKSQQQVEKPKDCKIDQADGKSPVPSTESTECNKTQLERSESTLKKDVPVNVKITSSKIHDTTENKTVTQPILEGFPHKETMTFESCLKHWRNCCTHWKVMNKEAVKTSIRRAVRKSSAAKRLPPISEEDIVNGRWPYSRGELPASIEDVNKVYIRLPDLPGRNLVLIQRCVSLTHLTLMECGLVSLEGLQSCPSLRHINVSHNDINVISCDGISRLESLVASSNKLSSIHGLSGCTSLMLLDLSNNNITRINGLESLIKLMDLRLANNQLIHIKGLQAISTLLSLNISGNHISSLTGIENCGLIRCIIAENNSISQLNVDELGNAVLLLNLSLSKNSLSHLDMLCDCEPALWLPSLHTLNISCNKLTMQDQIPGFFSSVPNLHTLDLHSNLVSDQKPILESVKPMRQLKVLDLTENLLSNAQQTSAVAESAELGFSVLCGDVESESQQEKFEAIVSNLIGSPVLKQLEASFSDQNATCVAQINKILESLSVDRKNVKKLPGWKSSKTNCNETFSHPPDLIPTHCEMLKSIFETSIEQRKWYERPYKINETKKLPQSTPKKVVPSQIDSHPSNSHGPLIVSTTQEPSKPKILSKHPKPDDPRFVLKSVKRSSDVSVVRSSLSSKVVYQQLERRKAGVLETFAATKIQATWRMYRTRKTYLQLSSRRLHAVVSIQAAWRGFVIRRNIKQAVNSFNTSVNEEEDSDFDEVDLDAYNFDEETYEQHWALRTDFKHNIQSSFETEQRPLDLSTVKTPLDLRSLIHPVVRSEFGSITKPPLPPITPTGHDSPAPQSIYAHESSVNGYDTERSKHSAKQERLTNEWGLNSQLTTELMLKRARKMKGRRRKEASAGDKLRKFQEISQKAPNTQTVGITRKPAAPPNKVEYFKAREAAFEKRDKQPSEMDEQRQQYTYEWLHTKATCEQPESGAQRKRSRDLPPVRPGQRSRESSSGGSAFLPSIPHRRSLVTSPLQVAGDMEVMSVSSYNSNKSRNKQLLRDIARRHGGYD